MCYWHDELHRLHHGKLQHVSRCKQLGGLRELLGRDVRHRSRAQHVLHVLCSRHLRYRQRPHARKRMSELRARSVCVAGRHDDLCDMCDRQLLLTKWDERLYWMYAGNILDKHRNDKLHNV